jgi:hypothetical protein
MTWLLSVVVCEFEISYAIFSIPESHATPLLSLDESLANLTKLLGFSGIRTMHGLTAHKFNCHMFEAGTTLGGAWYWNTYPGARVDTNVPLYQFTNNETWDQWDWTQKYPGWAE